MNHIREALFHRLTKKGIYPELIPGFIKVTCHAIHGSSSINVEEANERLHFLGWHDFDLDYHTLQLLIAGFETCCLCDAEPVDHLSFKGCLFRRKDES